MRYAASFTVHTPSTPSTRINITPVARREEAIQRGLKRRLEQLSEERERRARAAAAADEDFSAEFLTMARQVFDMIDVDESGYLDKDEIIDAVKANKKVINFLQTCGNQNLMYLLEPARLQQALDQVLAQMLADDAQRSAWSRNALAFAETADLYSMPQKAADVILGESA